MKKILVPTDFSPYAHNALLYATDFAKRDNAQITLFHTVVKEEDKGEAEPKLKNEIATLQKENQAAGNLNVDYVTESGPILEGFNKLLAKEKYDLIIMGTRSSDNINQNIGSFTSKITQKGKAHVLVVPENHTHQTIENVLITSDFTAPKIDPLAVEGMTTVVKILGAKAHLLHFSINENRMKGNASPASLFKDTSLAGQETLSIDGYQDLIDHLKKVIADQNINLIYLPSQQSIFTNIFVGNLSRHIALETQTPVYVYF